MPGMKTSDVTAAWVREQISRTGVAQKTIQAVVGLGDISMVSKMVRGRRNISVSEAEKLIAFFEEMPDRGGPQPKALSAEMYVGIPRYRVQLSGGDGASPFDDEPVDLIPFTREFLERRLDRASGAGLVMLEAVGDSMEPTISNGDLVMVDLQDSSLSGAIMAFRFDDEAFIKRLIKTPDGVRMVSDNKDLYPEALIPRDQSDSLKIFGRVRWIGRSI